MTAISPDSRVIAVGEINKTLLQETISGKVVWQIETGIQRTGIAFSPDGRTIALASANGLIQLLDWVSEKEILTLQGHSRGAYKLAFSPDGTRLASVGSGEEAMTVLIWDVSNAVRRPLPKRDVGPKDMEDWSKALSNTDARAAYRAVWNLVGVPEQAVPQLKAMISTMKWITQADVNRCIAELNNEGFATRQIASNRLIAAGMDAVEPVRGALKKITSLEQKRRLEEVLSAIHDNPIPAQHLFAMRALMVLEQVGNSEAWTLLEEWAKTVPETRLRSSAREVVERQVNSVKSRQ